MGDARIAVSEETRNEFPTLDRIWKTPAYEGKAVLSESFELAERYESSRAECEKLRAALETLVAALSEMGDVAMHVNYGDDTCSECEQPWPCPFEAARALVGSAPQTESTKERTDSARVVEPGAPRDGRRSRLVASHSAIPRTDA